MNKNWNAKRSARLTELELKHPGDLTEKEAKEMEKLRTFQREAENG